MHTSLLQDIDVSVARASQHCHCQGVLGNPTSIGERRRQFRAQSSSPLTKYAAQHWVDHAKFENVSTCVEFDCDLSVDPKEPCFEAWLNLLDVDTSWSNFTASHHKERRGSLRYYASLCGSRKLATHILGNPVGRNRSPLVAALLKRHLGIAGVDIMGGQNRTLHHAASAGRCIDIVQWLIDLRKKRILGNTTPRRHPNLERRMGYESRAYLATSRTRMTVLCCTWYQKVHTLKLYGYCCGTEEMSLRWI